MYIIDLIVHVRTCVLEGKTSTDPCKMRFLVESKTTQFTKRHLIQIRLKFENLKEAIRKIIM